MGWNTWLSGDMLTHALLPHGLAVKLTLHMQDGSHTLADLGMQGPKCDRAQFPCTHGLHAQRGEYTEISSLDFAGASYQVQSATTATGDLALLITLLTASSTTPAQGSRAYVNASMGVPLPWAPRVCAVTPGSKVAVASCPGLQNVSLVPGQGTAHSPTAAGFSILLPAEVGGSVSLMAVVAASSARAHELNGQPAPAPADPATPATLTTNDVTALVHAARQNLTDEFARSGRGSTHNETYAGMLTAISWNVIYTPYEGIFTPVFRGYVKTSREGTADGQASAARREPRALVRRRTTPAARVRPFPCLPTMEWPH